MIDRGPVCLRAKTYRLELLYLHFIIERPSMQFQLNTDSHIQADDLLAETAKTAVASALGHLTNRLTRVEVHLADVNAAKGGADDILCTIEARPEGMQPQTVTHSDADVDAALRGAGKKIRSLLDSEFGKLSKR
ncbi:HPF/RaiA family ribosome-associated protein [Roseovarius sp. D0-M9]|uniref:HPF/RaiA family ribosome-associated protein n=1 Tax=Roseovarius sp. D0-M9 TaxID=3127117 RepID=UPI0030103594